MDFVRVFSFDFSKAFDNVPHAIVCNKLMSLNMNPYVIDWIVSFLSNRVVVDGFVTEFVSINSCLLYTSPSPRDLSTSRMPSSA